MLLLLLNPLHCCSVFYFRFSIFSILESPCFAACIQHVYCFIYVLLRVFNTFTASRVSSFLAKRWLCLPFKFHPSAATLIRNSSTQHQTHLMCSIYCLTRLWSRPVLHVIYCLTRLRSRPVLRVMFDSPIAQRSHRPNHSIQAQCNSSASAVQAQCSTCTQPVQLQCLQRAASVPPVCRSCASSVPPPCIFRTSSAHPQCLQRAQAVHRQCSASPEDQGSFLIFQNFRS